MAEDNIRPFRTRDAKNVPTEEERALHKKIRRHRLGGRAAIVVLLLAAVILIAYFYMDYQRKTYSNYSIIEWNELSGMENSNSVSFGGNILRYNKDGVAYVDYTNAQIWNQPYEMGSPMLDVSDQVAAVADKGGNKIYLFDEKGLTGEIDTVLPIQKIAVSDADTVAVLLKDGSVSRVNYYNKSGEVISEMKIGMDNMGYPMAMDVSPDGKMFMLSFLSVSGGSLDTVISYYNFGNVGQEYKDRLVKSKTYEDSVFPEVEFLDDSTSVAYGDTMACIYKGSQIPEESATITFAQEIQSVFSDATHLGFILSNDKEGTPYLAEVYNLSGKKIFSEDVSLAYTQVKLDREKVILFNDTEFSVYSLSGIHKFEGEYESTIKDVISTNKQSRYIIITPTEMDKIKLE